MLTCTISNITTAHNVQDSLSTYRCQFGPRNGDMVYFGCGLRDVRPSHVTKAQQSLIIERLKASGCFANNSMR